MAYKIAIASGKGGTGKTTVSVNLYSFLTEKFEGDVLLVDCDVEEPNDVIFFQSAEKVHAGQVSQLIPEIDTEKCTFCRKCSKYCEFNAIVVIPPAKFAEVNASLCHSCGACMLACSQGAITEHAQPIGVVTHYETQKGGSLVEGKLKIGSAMQTMLIKELKKSVENHRGLLIYDAPPGTSCSVVETICDADYVILVAEPTLFGLHDLKLMVKLVRDLALPFGVIVNKAGLGNNSIYHFLHEEQIELLGEIPFSKEYASEYAEGRIIETVPSAIRAAYEGVLDVLNIKIGQA